MSAVNKKRYFQFFLVVLAAGVIYPIIYLRTNYSVTILEVFNLTNEELNNMYTMLGYAFVIGYIPSGLLADRFPAKWLIGISLLGVGLFGLLFAQVPNPGTVSIIFFGWGIFSVLTFWSSHLKIIKMLSTPSDEARFFGILDGGRGVVEAVMGSIGLAIFAAAVGSSDALADKQAGLVGVIYLFAIITIVSALLIILFVDNDKNLREISGESGIRSENDKFKLSQISGLLKNKYLYLMGGIVFTGYAVFWTVYYIGGFLQTNVGVTAVTVATVTTVILWMRPLGGTIGGFLGDKIGRAKTNGLALGFAGIVLILTSLLPVASPEILFFVFVVLLGFLLYVIRGTYWSLLGQSKFAPVAMGTAIGLVSFIGYLPDIILPQLNSLLFRAFGDTGGYVAYFIVSAIIGFIGIGLIFVFNMLNKKEETV